jgi:hypothetical protein
VRVYYLSRRSRWAIGMPSSVAIFAWAMWALVVLVVLTLWLLVQLAIGLLRGGAWLARRRELA